MGLHESILRALAPIGAFESPVLIASVSAPAAGKIGQLSPCPLDSAERSLPKIFVS